MKTKKSVLKAVMPFMLLGTPAIAGSSVRLGSKFRAQKTVIQSESISRENIKEEKSVQNPFGIFGETPEFVNKTNNEPVQVMSFLEDEGLLLSKSEHNSIISGDKNPNGLIHRKSFLATQIACITGATYNGKNLQFVSNRTFNNSYILVYGNSGSLYFEPVTLLRFNNAKVVCTPDTVPLASSVTFSGTVQEGTILTGTYDYTDTESDVEAGSIFKWYRSDDASGTNKTAISGATASTYVLTSTDIGKFISFEVTPINSSAIGVAVESAINSTAVLIIETIPTATNQAFSGNMQEGQTLTGTYTYADVNSDAEIGTTFQWYRSTDASGTGRTAITGATSATYVLTTADIGSFIDFEVTPVNANGTGTAVASTINATAVVSSTDTENSIIATNSSIKFNDALNLNIDGNTGTVSVGGRDIKFTVNNDGTFLGGVTLTGGETSSLDVQFNESNTSIDENGTVQTRVQVNNDASIETNLNVDGTVNTVVTYQDQVTTTTSNIAGADIVVNKDGSIVTTSSIEKNGFRYVVTLSTDALGKTSAKLVKINIATNVEEDLSNTLKSGTSFENGSKSEVLTLNDLIYIKVTTTLNNTLVVE